MVFLTPINIRLVSTATAAQPIETDSLNRLVGCIRKLRESKSRLYMQDEHPFIAGHYFDLKDGLLQ